MNPKVKNLIKVGLLTLVDVPLIFLLGREILKEISLLGPCHVTGGVIVDAGFIARNPCGEFNLPFSIIATAFCFLLMFTYAYSLMGKKWALQVNILAISFFAALIAFVTLR